MNSSEIFNIKKDRIPIWIMRQAGRYLSDYRNVRKKYNNLMEMFLDTNSVCEITRQPLRKFDLDSAIIFSDILTILYAMGIDISFEEGVSIKYENEDEIINKVTKFNIEILRPVFDSISILKGELNNIIGFAGSPFTVLCYFLERGSSKYFSNSKKFISANKNSFYKMVDTISDITIIYLKEQIKSGANIVKLFESCAFIASEEEFEEFILKPSKYIISEVKKSFPNIPFITYLKGAGEKNLKFVEETKVDVIAVDSGLSLEWMRDNIQKNCIIQGNLDPFLLAFDLEGSKKHVERIFENIRKDRLVFNLGSGIIPETPEENLREIIKFVRSF